MIYQQGKQTLTIVVRGEGVVGATESVEKTPDTSPKEEQDEKTTTTTKSSGISKRAKFITATHIAAAVIGLASAGLNYAIGDIAGTTGDKNYADLVQRDIEQYKDVIDVATATTMSAWYGSKGGPIVMAITAGIGFTTATVSKANKYLGREREYQIETFKMKNEINYARSRANINLTNGRLR